MEPQDTQMNDEMSIEDAKAAMGNATFLQDQLLSANSQNMGDQPVEEQPTDTSMDQQEAPEQDLNLESEEEPGDELKPVLDRLDEMDKKIDKINKDDEIESIKKEIEKLLNEDEQE